MRRIFFYTLICLSLSGGAFAAPPERIISLAPNLTEILYAMGLEERIVGVTSYCDQPPRAKDKPKIGGMSNPSLEAVVSLRPDMVVMTTDGNPREFEVKMRNLHQRTYVFQARQISELPQGIRDLGAALGAEEQALALALRIQDALDRMRAGGSAQSPKRKALFIVWPEPMIVAGPWTAMDDAPQSGCDLYRQGAREHAGGFQRPSSKTSYARCRQKGKSLFHGGRPLPVGAKGHRWD